jgi:hypothetical protein
MSDLAHTILTQVPWLKTFLAWAFATAVVLAIVAIPAYYLFLPITQRLRAELSQYLNLLRERHRKNAAERSEAQRALIARFAQDQLLRHLDSSSSRLWSRTNATLLQSVHDIQSQLSNVSGRVEEFTNALPELHEGLKAISNSVPKDFHLPTAEANLAQTGGTLRVARMALAISILLIISIITVNTGMLSQIIRDLGFSASLKFLGVPLFSVLALLITCVEGGLGFVHGVLSDPDLQEEGSKIHVGAILTSIGAVGIACVEGFFYSRIMPTRVETVTIPLIGYTLPQTDVFFIWGFLLVMTLFALGLTLYRMGARVLRGTALTTINRQLGSITRSSVRCTAALQRAEALTATARTALAPPGVSGSTSAPFASEAVERLLSELRKLSSAQPSWVTLGEQSLGLPEVINLSRHALLWFALAIGATLLVVFTGSSSFSLLGHGIGNPVFLALAQAAVVGTAGFLSAGGETVVQGADWQKVTAPNWGRLIGLVLLSIFTVSELLLAIPAYPVGIVFWVGNLLTCYVLAAACYQLMPLLALMDIWVQRAGHLFLSLFERGYRVFVSTFMVVSVLLDQVTKLLASPLLILTGHRDETTKALATYANDPH